MRLMQNSIFYHWSLNAALPVPAECGCPPDEIAAPRSPPHLGHQGLVVVQVVDGVEHGTEDFPGAEQVVQVGPGELGTGGAGAGRVQGPVSVSGGRS